MERMILLAGAMFAVLAAAPAGAEPAPTADTTTASSDLSAQARPRARLRVYPGRLLYRDCDFKLVQQWRPSGPVIVPRQRCWWVRG
jgi:hypothetical protein